MELSQQEHNMRNADCQRSRPQTVMESVCFGGGWNAARERSLDEIKELTRERDDARKFHTAEHKDRLELERQLKAAEQPKLRKLDKKFLVGVLTTMLTDIADRKGTKEYLIKLIEEVKCL